MARMPSFDPINYLIEKRFPRILHASSSPLADEDAQKRFYNREKQIEEFVRELRQKSDEEIDKLVKEEEKKESEQRALSQKNAERRMWYNLPASAADFEHWSKAAYWTLDEGIALSFGKDPSKVSWKKLDPYRQISPFVAGYANRKDLAERAVAMKQLFQTNIPGFFLGWAKRNTFELPPQLLELVEQNGQIVADWPDLLKKANERTEEAFEQGSFRPDRGRRPTPQTVE